MPSPDGQRFFSHHYPDGLQYRAPERLFVSGPDKDAKIESYPFNPFMFNEVPFQWASDSRSIWVADQKREHSNWATDPVRPMLILADGTLRALPNLAAPGERLDGLRWIGNDGLAIAQYGTRGGYYRPERPDTDPEMALVDAKTGRTLGTFLFKNFPKAVGAVGGPMVPLTMATMVLPDGRPRVVMQWPSRYSLMWTQGSEPREIALPKFSWGTAIALMPDGKRLLISYPLSPTGAICEYNDDGVDPCPPPTPVTGPLAELIDIETGRSHWRIDDTAKQFGGHRGSAISPDGRYALIGIPERNEHNVALISMADGKILQTMYGQGSSTQMTFGSGRRFFLSFGAYVATYELSYD